MLASDESSVRVMRDRLADEEIGRGRPLAGRSWSRRSSAWDRSSSLAAIDVVAPSANAPERGVSFVGRGIRAVAGTTAILPSDGLAARAAVPRLGRRGLRASVPDDRDRRGAHTEEQRAEDHDPTEDRDERDEEQHHEANEER